LVSMSEKACASKWTAKPLSTLIGKSSRCVPPTEASVPDGAWLARTTVLAASQFAVRAVWL
jgi:hypothetical protein